jgi:hypothetical protein
MALDIKRVLPDIAYTTAGQVSVLDLPRDSVMKGLSLMWTLVLTTATTAGSGTLNAWDGLAAIRRLEIVADGALTLWSIDPIDLAILDNLWYGTSLEYTNLAIPSTGTSGTMQYALYIPFALPFSKDPNLTLLNAAALTSLQLKVTWGAIADLVQTVANTTINVASVVTPETHEITGLTPESIFSAFKVSQLQQDITATTSRQRVQLARGNLMKMLMLRSRILTNGIGASSEGLLNQVDIESSELNRGTFLHRRIRATDTDATGRQGFHIRNDAKRLYSYYDGALISAATAQISLAGVYPIEFSEDGQNSSMIRTQPYSSFDAYLNVVNTGTSPTHIITQCEVLPAVVPSRA